MLLFPAEHLRVDLADFFVVLVRRGLWRHMLQHLAMLGHVVGRVAGSAHAYLAFCDDARVVGHGG